MSPHPPYFCGNEKCETHQYERNWEYEFVCTELASEKITSRILQEKIDILLELLKNSGYTINFFYDKPTGKPAIEVVKNLDKI